MEILQLKVMRGPNFWSSAHHSLIVLKLRKASYTATEQVIRQLHKSDLHIPEQLYPHVTNSQLIAYIAVALQRAAGMDCGFLPDLPAEEDDHLCVVFPYELENAGVLAANAAVDIFNSYSTGTEYPLAQEIGKLSRIYSREGLGPTTRAIAREAKHRHIPVTRLDEDSLIMLGQGSNQRIIRTAVAGTTSAIAVELAQNKDITKNILSGAHIPIPEGVVIEDLEELIGAVEEIGFPLVIKPLDGNHGRGITTDINSAADAVKAFQLARQISDEVIAERYILGDDHRFLVINFKLAAVARRTPARVTGDGQSTIQQLVDQLNKDPRRGEGHTNVMTVIRIDQSTLAILAARGLTPDSVLPMGVTQNLKDTANLSSGGTAEDVTGDVHPANRAMAERIARLMDLNICGIDIIAKTVAQPITSENGAVVEVNAGPGLRMHLAPSAGQPRNVAEPIVEMLYPNHAPARIPIVAITGTNGKTTTTRLIAHLAKQAGYNTGYTTTDGIYIGGQLIESGDCSGPRSAFVVLRDPLVEFAVLECARGGILRSGLGFDHCDISIVTNISEDHLGLDGIETAEQLAKVKAVVPKGTAEHGHAILNADDDLVYGMKDGLNCNIGLFTLNVDNPRLQQHMEEGKPAAFIENNSFFVSCDTRRYRIANISEVPLTFGGTSECMIKNVLPSILAAVISNFSVRDIRNGLMSFKPSAENTPGRMNYFEFGNFSLMLDYAHNEGGYRELKAYASHINASVKTGVIAATGDRREQDIRNLGSLAAEIFDEIIIRHDKDGRGRTNEQLTALLTEGIRAVKPEMTIKVISDKFESIAYAIHHAEKNSWIFVNY
jgi:cyanophycin synthetase